MAIPKVCGIETEYDFVIFDARGRQITSWEHSGLMKEFVEIFLRNKKTQHYNKCYESPLKSVFGRKEPGKVSRRELKHRRWVLRMPCDIDGFLENGARFYLDCTHPEYSTPECLLPLDLVAHDKAGELALLEAQELFRAQCPDIKDCQVLVYKINSDGFSHSFGSHLNVLLPRKLFSDREGRQRLLRQYIPFQIARLVLIGGGKIGSENRRPDCEFQISQRADFCETRVGVQTTEYRPIFNTRDEPHADRRKFFRLHDISTDSLMCETANFLRVALTQVVLSMIEDGFLAEDWFPENPVRAMATVSRDLKFNQPLRLESGKRLTGLELLRVYLLKARDYLKDHPMDNQHQSAVQTALELLVQLEKNPLNTFGKLDWTTAWFIQKHSPAQSAGDRNLLFREISAEGLYFQWLKEGELPRLLDDQTILAARTNAPVNTRACLRSALLKQRFDQIEDVNWTSVWLKDEDGFQEVRMDVPMLDKDYYSQLLLKLQI